MSSLMTATYSTHDQRTIANDMLPNTYKFNLNDMSEVNIWRTIISRDVEEINICIVYTVPADVRGKQPIN